MRLSFFVVYDQYKLTTSPVYHQKPTQLSPDLQLRWFIPVTFPVSGSRIGTAATYLSVSHILFLASQSIITN